MRRPRHGALSRAGRAGHPFGKNESQFLEEWIPFLLATQASSTHDTKATGKGW